MVIISLISLISIIFMFFLNLVKLNNKGLKSVLTIIFIFIFIFLSLRYDYGNDYMSYYLIFLDYTKYDYLYNPSLEIGWLFLNKIFSNLGFFLMIAFLSFFYLYILYYFILKKVDPKYFWLSLFLLLIVPSNMLINLSAMRQSVAISFFTLFVFSFFGKKYIFSFFLLILGFLFHKTIIFAFIIFLMIFFSKKINNLNFILFSLLGFFLIFLFNGLIFNFINPLLLMITDKYSVYNEAANFKLGIGVIFQLLLFVVINFYNKDFIDKNNEILLRLSSLVFILTPIILIDQNLVRISFYFEMLLIFSIPIMLKNIENIHIRYGIISLFLAWYLFSYISFFNNPLWIKSYLEYKTIFSVG